MSRNLTRVLFLLGISAAVFGCEEGATGGSGSGSAGADSQGRGPTTDAGRAADRGPPAPQFESQRNNLRFKGGARLRLDWARALDTTPDALCREIENFDCLDFVHVIALGGVDPYSAGIHTPFKETPVSAPMIVERVALNACARRWNADAATPDQAKIFGEVLGSDRIPEGGAGDTSKDAVVIRLYNRALLREPTGDELATFRSMYTQIESRSDAPAQEWAKLSCFVVLTSVESLFY